MKVLPFQADRLLHCVGCIRHAHDCRGPGGSQRHMDAGMILSLSTHTTQSGLRPARFPSPPLTRRPCVSTGISVPIQNAARPPRGGGGILLVHRSCSLSPRAPGARMRTETSSLADRRILHGHCELLPGAILAPHMAHPCAIRDMHAVCQSRDMLRIPAQQSRGAAAVPDHASESIAACAVPLPCLHLRSRVFADSSSRVRLLA
jgi:hypothetical protein